MKTETGKDAKIEKSEAEKLADFRFGSFNKFFGKMIPEVKPDETKV